MNARKKIIDVRSDTVTRPTPAMLEAMFSAEVGDDVFEEDPTIKKLESKTAAMFGHEAALFCPSGTMTNQVGIRILTQPQQEIILDQGAHIYFHEGGGLASNSGLSVRLLNGDRGRINPQQITDNINPVQNLHQPISSVVAVENTHNKGGGSYYTFAQLKAIVDTCRHNNLKVHLDGARIFNALTETGDDVTETGKMFDTVSVCMSKGLGAPVGSLLVSSAENILKAKRVRKSYGGGMRQAGYLAAACIYALDNNIGRLKEDHKRAKIIGDVLKSKSWVTDMLPVDTNIIVFQLAAEKPVTEFLNYLSNKNIKAVPFGKQLVRMVTHLDFDDDMLEELITAINTFH
jgi:threonine aldolase